VTGEIMTVGEGGIEAEQTSIIVKTYKGSQEKATQLFQEDALEMAEKGYFPTSQSYAQGSYGCGAFLLALLLCVLIIGIIIFIYMLIVKPDGILSVTYEYRGLAAKQIVNKEGKTCPRCAEQVKAAAKMCRFCGYEFHS